MQRNYRFFFMFVSSATLLCVYVFSFCWVYVIRIMHSEDTSIWRALIKTPASIVLIIYTFLSVWFVGGLTVFHLYLISTNQVWSPPLYVYASGGNMGRLGQKIESCSNWICLKMEGWDYSMPWEGLYDLHHLFVYFEMCLKFKMRWLCF